MDKKFRNYILGIIALLLLTITVINLPIFAVAEETSGDKIKTDMLNPASYLEYTKLDSPTDVYVDNDYIIVAEKNRIITYDKLTKNITHTELSPSEFNIKKISRSGNNLIFLSKLHLYVMKLGSEEITTLKDENDSDVLVSSYFNVNGNSLLANNDTQIYLYEIIESAGKTHLKKSAELDSYDNATIFTPYPVVMSQNGKIYYGNGTSIYEQTANEEIWNFSAVGVGSINYMVEYQGILYFTTQKGLYGFDLDTRTCRTLLVASQTNETVGQLANPYGFCIYGRKIYVVDGQIQAVCEYNLDDSTFTGFSITANDNANGRIKANSTDLQYQDGKIYVFAPNTVTEIENDTVTNYSLPKIIGYEPTLFAHTGDFVLSTNGNKVIVYKKVNGEYENIADISMVNITSITEYNGDFYVLQNTTEYTNQYSSVYKFSVKDLQFDQEYLFKVAGAGNAITCDANGNIYINVVGSNKIYKYNLTSKEEPSIYCNSYSDVKKLQADFVGNLYLLLGDESIKYIQKNKTKTVDKSQFIFSNNKLVSMAISYSTVEVFFLYDGFILKSTDSEALDITTPSNMKIPSSFNFNLSTTVQKVTLNYDKKIFRVSKPDKSNLYLSFDGDVMAKQGTEFIYLAEIEDCYLVVSDEYYLLNKQDVTVNTTPYIEKPEIGESGFLVDKIYLYNLPCLLKEYSTKLYNTRDDVKITKGIEINGVTYLLVEIKGNTGYIPQSFVSTGFIEETEKTNYKTSFISGKHVTLYNSYSDAKEKIATLDQNTKVIVYEEVNGYTRVYAKGNYGYVKSTEISDKGDHALRNTLIILIVALSLTATAIYLELKLGSK